MKQRITLSEAILFALGYLSIWVIFTYPAVMSLSHAYIGGARLDGGLYTWITKYIVHTKDLSLNAVFDAPMFYPFGGTLSYSDNYLLPAFISRIVFKLCGNMAIAYNVPLIVAFLLNAISMAMLAQYLFSNRTVSFLAGLFLLLSPVMLGQVAHPQLLHFYFIPFTLLFTLRYLQHNRASDAVLSSLMVLGAFLSAVYYSFFCIMMIGGIFLYYCVANKFLSTAKKALRYFLFALPAMTILVFFAQFYLATREVFSSWPLGVVRMLSARWVSYIVAPIGNTLWAPLTYKYVKAEDTLFPGLIVLLLGVLAILCFLWKVLSRKQFILVICFLTFIVGLNFILQNIEPVNILIHSVVPWLLLLSALYLARKTSNNPQLFISGLLLFLCLLFLTNSFGVVSSTKSSLPHLELFYLLHHYVPGFNSLRVVSRFGFVVAFLLMLLALQALSRLNKKHLSAAFVAICLVYPFEARQNSFLLSPDTTPSLAHQALETINTPGAAIGLPFYPTTVRGVLFAESQTEQIHWLFPTTRAVVNGYSGKIPQFVNTMGRFLENFPSSQALAKLGQIVDLRYLVFDGRQFSEDKRKEFEAKLADFSEDLTMIGSYPDGSYLIELHPVIPITKLSPAELYLPPADYPRALSGSFSVVGDLIEIPVQVGFHYEATKKLPTMEILKVSKPEENRPEAAWQEFSLVIPPSTHTIIPHKVIFNVTPGTELEIKGLSAIRK